MSATSRAHLGHEIEDLIDRSDEADVRSNVAHETNESPLDLCDLYERSDKAIGIAKKAIQHSDVEAFWWRSAEVFRQTNEAFKNGGVMSSEHRLQLRTALEEIAEQSKRLLHELKQKNGRR